MRIVTGILIFMTIGGSFYGFSRVTKADAINTTDFVTTWKTDNAGVSNSSSITIPVNNWSTYNYSVDWNNDGVVDETGITGSVTHDFGTPGTYTIRISGLFPAIYFYINTDAEKILDVNQWGNNHWETMQNAFMGAHNLVVSATDSPDLSGVTDMTSMFYEARSMNQNLNNWDVSNVRFMRSMFQYASTFNQPLSNWNTGNVRDMANMFYLATSFNQNIGAWNTSNVTDMSGMFSNANTFNNGGSGTIDSWNTGSVTDMSRMFQHAIAFNQPIGSWNTSSVTTFGWMFQSATAFNQPLGSWNTASATEMTGMFMIASSFDQPLNAWVTSNVTQMGGMFNTATSFDQPLGSWDTANVNDMSAMFNGATSFNQPLNGWNVSSVTTMGSMFAGATSFNQPLNSWDVSHVAYMDSMFASATSFNQPLNSWTTNSLTNTFYMFYNATSFNQPLNAWNMSNVTDMTWMFTDATAFNQPLDTWNTGNVTGMYYMFRGATSFNQSLSNWNVSNVANMEEMLSNSGLSLANYDSVLTSWSAQAVQPDVFLGATGRTYCAAQTAHQSLIDSHNWVITGDSLSCGSTGPVTQNADFEPLGSAEDTAVSKATLSVISNECYTISMPSLSVLGPNGISAPQNVRILGGLAYNLTCTSSGGSTTATITLGTHFDDVSKLRVYKKTGSSNLVDITSLVAITNRLNSGNPVTTFDYTLIDGGAFDEDGVANGTIVDPVYVGVVASGSSVTLPTLAETGQNVGIAAIVSITAILSGFWALYRKLA